MRIIPAIDIIEGKCVRLSKGDYNTKIIYNENPLEVAKSFEAHGIEYLHLVDLDGAKSSQIVNYKILEQIATQTKLKIDFGGGLKSDSDLKIAFESGANQITGGSIAVKNRELFEKWIAEYGSDKIILGADANNEKVAVSGWLEDSNEDLIPFIQDYQSKGIQYVICTDIAKDGMLEGPSFDLYAKILAEAKGIKLIASGGISTFDELPKLAELGCEGTIIGKAIYEGRISLTKRIIPCLDIKNGRTVKGINFVDLRDAGDPVELAKIYSDEGADELVFLDISATEERRKTLVDLVRKVASTINIPFTVGGGISSVEDVEILLQNGADKVSINSSAVKNPQLINDLAQKFGSQCVVVAIDAKQINGQWIVHLVGGKVPTELNLFDWAKEVEERGAGEILFTSMDNDGTKNGFANEALAKLSELVNIPIIASGGAGNIQHFVDTFLEGKADAALAASVFHFKEIEIKTLKAALKNNNIEVRI